MFPECITCVVDSVRAREESSQNFLCIFSWSWLPWLQITVTKVRNKKRKTTLKKCGTFAQFRQYGLLKSTDAGRSRSSSSSCSSCSSRRANKLACSQSVPYDLWLSECMFHPMTQWISGIFIRKIDYQNTQYLQTFTQPLTISSSNNCNIYWFFFFFLLAYLDWIKILC